MKQIVIIGAGFGGLRLARKLNNNPKYKVTIIDRENHHQFQPLFYQVATAGLDASNISFPLRKIFQESTNVSIRIAEVTSIEANKNTVITNEGDFIYDYLVIATGANTNFFNNAEISRHALPMKTTAEALEIKYRLVQNFEDATNAKTEVEREQYMNICVIGGGPTGVELSGTLAEMKKHVLPKDYPDIDFSKLRILLFEGSDTTLENMKPKSALRSMQYLKALGVTLKTSTKVVSYDGQIVTTNTGEKIVCKLVIWAAGIKGNILPGIDEKNIARGNRIITNNLCQVIGTPNIYAIGDVACMQTPATPNGHPQVAPVATQQADLIAKNWKAMENKNFSIDTFEYHDKGSMATVGRNMAVVDLPIGNISLGGLLAWLIWMGLHLMLILGVKNKLFIFFNWLYSYLTYDQSLRLVFRKNK
jgi:NADH:ubiquinone reductase (H+-translocating)